MNKVLLKQSIICIILGGVLPLFAANRMAQADSLFERRNENFDIKRLLADTVYVNQAATIYEDLLVSTSDSQEKSEALWKLLQTYYFKGQFCAEDEDVKQEIYEEGIEIGETYITEIPESVEVYMWLGINWARWAEVSGVLAAAMKGVAGKVKEYAEKAIELDENYLGGGGYRLLGMLHLSVPNIPLILSWPSNEEGLLNLEKAYKIAPGNLYNKMYLAMAYHAVDQNERSKSLLLEIINTTEIVHDLAIDSFIKKEAENYLNKEL